MTQIVMSIVVFIVVVGYLIDVVVAYDSILKGKYNGKVLVLPSFRKARYYSHVWEGKILVGYGSGQFDTISAAKIIPLPYTNRSNG